MLWTIVVLLLILWLLGFTFSVGGSLIHLLLVLALVVFVFNLITGRRGVVWDRRPAPWCHRLRGMFTASPANPARAGRRFLARHPLHARRTADPFHRRPELFVRPNLGRHVQQDREIARRFQS